MTSTTAKRKRFGPRCEPCNTCNAAALRCLSQNKGEWYPCKECVEARRERNCTFTSNRPKKVQSKKLLSGSHATNILRPSLSSINNPPPPVHSTLRSILKVPQTGKAPDSLRYVAAAISSFDDKAQREKVQEKPTDHIRLGSVSIIDTRIPLNECKTIGKLCEAFRRRHMGVVDSETLISLTFPGYPLEELTNDTTLTNLYLDGGGILKVKLEYCKPKIREAERTESSGMSEYSEADRDLMNDKDNMYNDGFDGFNGLSDL